MPIRQTMLNSSCITLKLFFSASLISISKASVEDGPPELLLLFLHTVNAFNNKEHNKSDNYKLIMAEKILHTYSNCL